MKPTSNAPFMSRSESGSDDDRSANRELVVPSPVELSDSDDDGFSLSQHELAMKKQMAKHDTAPNSTSASDEEEEEEEENEVEQSIHGESSTCFESTTTAAIFSRFTEMSRQFAEMMEMHWKQQLVSKKKSVGGTLSFESFI